MPVKILKYLFFIYIFTLFLRVFSLLRAFSKPNYSLVFFKIYIYALFIYYISGISINKKKYLIKNMNNLSLFLRINKYNNKNALYIDKIKEIITLTLKRIILLLRTKNDYKYQFLIIKNN